MVFDTYASNKLTRHCETLFRGQSFGKSHVITMDLHILYIYSSWSFYLFPHHVSGILIVFIDTEVGGKSNQILDYGAIRGDDTKFHSHSGNEFYEFVKNSKFICGHNIIRHDLNISNNRYLISK